MPDHRPADGDESPRRDHDHADISDAAENVADEIEASGDDVPPSRRERAKEEARDHLEASDGDGLHSATAALEMARAESQEAAERLERARRTVEQIEQVRKDTAAVERILQHVVRERSFYADAGSELASERGDTQDGDEP